MRIITFIRRIQLQTEKHELNFTDFNFVLLFNTFYWTTQREDINMYIIKCNWCVFFNYLLSNTLFEPRVDKRMGWGVRHIRRWHHRPFWNLYKIQQRNYCGLKIKVFWYQTHVALAQCGETCAKYKKKTNMVYVVSIMIMRPRGLHKLT